MKKLLGLMALSTISMCVVLAGCKDDESSGGSGADAAALMDSLTNPTGAVTSAEGAQGVSEAFGAKLSAMSGGSTAKSTECSPSDVDVEKTCDCEQSGSETVIAHGTSSAYTIDYTFDACCDSADGCCWDGTGWVSGSQDTDAAYTNCLSYDLVMTCPDATGNGDVLLEYCQDASGVQWYLVEYVGETYSVSGSYNSASGGTWTIVDANGTWSCTQDSTGAGSCTDGTDTYSW
jgi:hypothetical protein